MAIINLNSKFYEDDEKVLSVNNRAFRYGDALFETIRFYDGKVLFLEEHLNRLKSGANTLKMDFKPKFDISWLRHQIINLIEKNSIKNDARIRLTVFREEGGLYTPKSNGISYLIEVKELEHNGFVLNSDGLTIGLYDEFKKPANTISNLKSTNCIYLIQAGIYTKENNLDDCLLINSDNNIAEAISSNVFIVKNNKIYTPDLYSACVDGIMRKQIIKIAKLLGIQIQEIELTTKDIETADEIFLTNAINGIKWIQEFRSVIYDNTTSKHLIKELNQIARH
ncbi:aminotransferase class IV [Bacteroidota bacterium]